MWGENCFICGIGTCIFVERFFLIGFYLCIKISTETEIIIKKYYNCLRVSIMNTAGEKQLTFCQSINQSDLNNEEQLLNQH